MTQVTAAMVKALRDETGAGMMDVKAALTEATGNMEEAKKILRKKGLAAAGKKSGRVTAEGAVQALVERDVAPASARDVAPASAGEKGVLVEVNCETDFVGRNERFRAFAEDVARVIAHSTANSVEELMKEPWPNDPESATVAQKVASMIASIKENITVRRFARYEAESSAAIGTYVHGGGKIGVMVEVAESGAKTDKLAEVARDIAMHIAAAEPRFLRREDVTQKDLDTEKEIARDQAVKSGKPENIVEKMVTGKMEKFYGQACLLEQPYIRDDKATVSQYLARQGKEAGCQYVITRFTRYKLGEGIEKPPGDDFATEVMSFQK